MPEPTLYIFKMKLNLNNSELKICAGTLKQFPSVPVPQIAMVGRSNVGKSSLINCLLGRKSLARVSNKPGKTVTVNFYSVDSKLFLVDLPGYGYAKRSAEDKAKWSELTDGYFTKNPDIDLLKLVLLLADSRIGMTENDISMADYLRQTRIPYIVVLTKTDKLSASEKSALEESVIKGAGTLAVPCSSVSGEGKDRIWDIIMRHAGF